MVEEVLGYPMSFGLSEREAAARVGEAPGWVREAC